MVTGMHGADDNGAPAYERIQQRTVVAQVMEKMKDLIASGRYKVGDRIPTEQELVQRFGIGRSSIREAIKIFQHLGILETRVPKGTFVRDRANIAMEALSWSVLLGEKETYEVIELREVVEQRGFAALVDRLRRKDPHAVQTLTLLETQVAAMADAAAESSIDKLVRADYEFHQAVVAQSGNSLFRSIFATLHLFTIAEIRETYLSMDDLAEVPRDHGEIVAALKSKSRAKALARHGAHFVRIKRLLKS